MIKLKRYLITGASGFIGSHLTDFIYNKGNEILAIVRPNKSLRNLSHYTTTSERIEIKKCDIKNVALLEKLIVDFNPESIFHLAAQPLVKPSWEDPINTIRTNVIGTINIFEILKRNEINSEVFLACSSAEYGTTTELNRPLKEEDPLRAIHPYGISKIAAELLARQYYINFGIKSVNLRYFLQTGPRKRNDACSDFIRAVAKIELGMQKPVISVGNLSPHRDIMGIKDTINATWLVALKGKLGETYNICSGRKLSIRDILNIAIGLSSKKIKIKEKVPEKLRNTDEDMIVGDNSKLKKLGFKVTEPIEITLEKMFEYWINYYKNDKKKQRLF